MARIEEESTMTRDQSIWSAARKRASNTSCSSSQTPAACQSRRRRQQLIPLPQPISCGSRSQRRPVCRMQNTREYRAILERLAPGCTCGLSFQLLAVRLALSERGPWNKRLRIISPENDQVRAAVHRRVAVKPDENRGFTLYVWANERRGDNAGLVRMAKE